MDEIYIGLMTGTSADSLDCAAVKFVDNSTNIIGVQNYNLPEKIKNEVLYLSSSQNIDSSRLRDLDEKLGLFFADKVKEFMEELLVKPEDIKAIGSHGQTIKHEPNSAKPFSLQIGNPQLLSNELNLDIVANFRDDDIEAGGQGAPLSPLFHREIFKADKNRLIVNIGGITNLTYLSDKGIVGFDTGPGNCLIDAWSRKNGIGEFDDKGEWARSGEINQELLGLMLEDDYFNRKYPKSTGPDYFSMDWLLKLLEKLKSEIIEKDIQATLLELTAMALCKDIEQIRVNTEEIYFCGGGSHNLFLMERINDLSKRRCLTTQELGVEPDYLEAICFAWLARERVKGTQFDMQDITGSVGKVFLGKIYNPTI